MGARSTLLRTAAPAALLLLSVFSCGARAIAQNNPAAAASYDSSRTVSIGGSVTEILYAIGADQKIAAIDTTSLYPPQALKEKPNVGYMRQLSPEGVLGLSPTLILALEGSGPKEAIDVLKAANIPFVTIPDRFTADGIVEKIHLVAQDVGLPDRGECLAGAAGRDLATLDAMRRRIRRRIKLAFILSLANGRPMIAGRGTAADGIMTMAGADNAFADFDGYKMVNDEAIAAAKPEAVLVMQRGEHALTAADIFSQPALAMTPAAQRQAFVSMEGLYLLGFGPRSAAAARDLAQKLYPDIAAAELPSERDAGSISCAR
jgi:iron complex transport system substrate-binding protein